MYNTNIKIKEGGIYMVNTKASKLRECKLNPQESCEACKHCGVCPYPYCQSIDCNDCWQKKFCPMCQGDCDVCQKVLTCRIYFPDAKV